MSTALTDAASERLLYLCEMFPELSPADIARLIGQLPAARLETLVDRCLSLQPSAPISAPSTLAPIDLTSDDHPAVDTPVEMVSLVPPSTESTALQTDVDHHHGAVPPPTASPSGPAHSKDPLDSSAPHKPSGSPAALGERIDAFCRANGPTGHAKIAAALRIVARAASNIIESPHEPRFRQLSLSNSKLTDKFSGLTDWVSLFTAIGFSPIDVPDGPGLLVMDQDHSDGTSLSRCVQELHHHIELLGSAAAPSGTRGAAPVLTSAAGQPAPKSEFSDVPESLYVPKSKLKSSSSAKRPNARAAPPARISRDRMAALAEKRLKGNNTDSTVDSAMDQLHSDDDRKSAESSSAMDTDAATAAGPSPSAATAVAAVGVRAGRIGDFEHNAQLRRQIQEVRQRQKDRWRTTAQGRQRVYTVNDLEDMRRNEIAIRGNFATNRNPTSGPSAQQQRGGVHTIGGLMDDLGSIGRRALELTNEFRSKNGLPPVQWNQTLCDIGYGHSKDMGDGKVPFDHVGFNERVRQYPYPARSAAENLAWNSGIADVARAAVNGWIDSPGHRKNLLSNSNFCGIGVYRNTRGQFYLTQLFALW